MDDAQQLQQLAEKCRRLANSIGDAPARESLQSLAAEYEQRASETPLMKWPDRR
jgi:hypothetical protein